MAIAFGLIAIAAPAVGFAVDGGAISYDPARRAYFVTGDVTFDGDISGSDVNVGKDARWNTLPGTGTLTVATGANIPAGPSGGTMHGVRSYGAWKTEVVGGNVDYFCADDNSALNIRSGSVYVARCVASSTLNMSGGSVFGIHADGRSTIHLCGGSVGGAILLSADSVLRIAGRNLSANYAGYSLTTMSDDFVITGDWIGAGGTLEPMSVTVAVRTSLAASSQTPRRFTLIEGGADDGR
jgi:hypothetical protein